MKKIRVLIVEDSQVIRQLLEHVIGSDPRLEIAGSVDTAEEALRILNRVAPDVISMDIRLPGMDGFEATQQIMRERPTPVVVISAGGEDSQLTMNALRAGALAVLEKPPGVTSNAYEALAENLCTQLAIMSQVKVVRRWIEARPVVRPERRASHLTECRAVGIACSTGGPKALIQLLGGLGASFPLPIFLVQHITNSFLEGFASWLQDVCPFSVEIVRDRSVTVPGTIYLAAAEHHLRAESGFACAERGKPVSGQCPSGTVLFESMAVAFGSQALGVLLTGMGDDGARGLVQLRQSGGYTIAEDESTAVVYGMPAEAVRLGGVSESLPLPAIAPRILDLIPLYSEASS